MHPNSSSDVPGFAAENPGDFQRIREVFESALELAEPERAGYVADACGSEPVIFAEVHRMLAADSKTFPLLDGIPQCSARLQPGDTVAGHFAIEGLLGRGGMGEVYRCRDTALGRMVALKVLPERIASNPDALARFRREAKLLASLNHPNIAVIHNTEQVADLHALVLEFIEGPTLADLIAAGRLPIERALAIARQIADALETAHEAGIVHRDLKPANVKVRPDGSVKVLDFGLASGRAALSTTEHRSPEGPADPALTDGQALMGTPAYMSPEQAHGDQVDRRADIWAFGAVLYEMLSGRAAFSGESSSEILNAVLRDQVDWSRIPSATPPAILKLIQRCLDREVRRRLRDIGEARIALEDSAAGAGSAVREPWLWRLAAVLLIAGLVFIGSILLWKQQPPRPAATRMSIPMPEGQSLFGNRSRTSISRDGRYVVYASAGQLRLRNLTALDFVTIRGTEGYFNITEPVFSPDGKWIAFHTGSDQTIKRIPVEGGAALKVCDSIYPSSLNWTSDGILFVEPGNAEIAASRPRSNQPHSGILLVSPEGGEPKHLVRTKNREVVHGPQLLDGGRLLFTFTEWNSPESWDTAQIVVEKIATGERTVVVRGGTDARYIQPGYLVYAVAGSLVAAPFDVRRLKLTGPAVPVVEGVRRADPESTGGAHYSIAANGTLLYVPGPVSPSKELVITDRRGTRERLPLPAGIYETPRVSPKGDRIAFGINERGKSDIYMYELSGRSSLRRLTRQGKNRLPVWLPDGTRIAYQSDRDGDRAIFCQPADGSGPVERLTRAAQDEVHEPETWSPDGTVLLFSVRRSPISTPASAIYTGESVLSALSLKTGQVRVFDEVRSATPAGATFSPDGKWVAYASTVSDTPNVPSVPGKTTITVQPFPPTGARYELARDGKPNHPQWSRDGKALFFVPGPEQFMAVPVIVQPTFSFGNAISLPPPGGDAHTLKPRAYDVLPDGRFIGVLSLLNNHERAGSQMVVVLDWLSELRARVPESR